MKRVFLDCGSNLGQGYEEIKQNENINENFEVHMFEPNPHCFKKLLEKYSNSKHINIHNKAVYSKNGFTKFYITTDLQNNINTYSKGSKISEVKGNFTQRSHLYSYAKPIKVELIRLSDFINLLDADEIIIKLDVEGSEYNILNDLINTNSLTRVKKIYTEFHDYAIDPDKRSEYIKQKLHIKEVIKQKNIDLIEWK